MKSILVFAALSLLCVRVSGQNQIETFMNEARDYLAKEDYRQAQLSLQDAINEINNLIAGQISDALPDEINGLKGEEAETGGTGAMGMIGGGMQITKHYQNPTKQENEADLTILANAPMLNMINMYLTNPGMMGQGYKSVRVGTHRAIMKTDMEDAYDDNGNSKQIRSSEIQIPLSQTLITIDVKGFATEQDELAFAQKLDLDKLKTVLGE